MSQVGDDAGEHAGKLRVYPAIYQGLLVPDQIPWSTGRNCEKAYSEPQNERPLSSKRLIFGRPRMLIPYATEHGNKSNEQGHKTADLGAKSLEH
jgi:hypothetical protein